MIEIESCYAVVDENPLNFIEAIQAYDGDAFEFEQQHTQTIRDMYWDTFDRQFQSRELALRLRTKNNQKRITLKGKGELLPSGALKRMELEGEFASDILHQIRDYLKEYNIAWLVPRQIAPEEDPVKLFLLNGVQVIQDRVTFRYLWKVRHYGFCVAECTLDQVNYHFANRKIVHFEVEVELVKGADPALLSQIGEVLMSLSTVSLKPWPHSKLATGFAIERAVLQKGVDATVSEEDHYLIPDIYTELAQFFH